jgi:prevent-host-death family protein
LRREFSVSEISTVYNRPYTEDTDDGDRHQGNRDQCHCLQGQCLALIDAVAQGKTARVVLTQHGRPVAALVPYEHSRPDLSGALRGSVTVPAGTDLTAGTHEVWLADA